MLSLQTVKSFQLQNVALDKGCGNQKYMCPCCGSCISNWLPHRGRLAVCPKCGAYERHRAVCFDFITDAPRPLLEPNPIVAYFGPHINHTKILRGALPQMHVLEFDFFTRGYHYSRTTIKADLQDIPLQAKALDGVIVLHVLEHVPKLLQAVRELSRVVRTGGFVEPTTPCYGKNEIHFLSSQLSMLECDGDEENCTATRQSGKPGHLCVQKDHLHGFSCTYLRRVFEDHNFSCRVKHHDFSVAERFGIKGNVENRFRCYCK